MQIRLMKIADYEQLWSLWNSCAGMGLNNLDDTRDGLARFLARNPTTCFVACDGETAAIVGAIMAGNDGRRGYIYHTAVSEPYRKQGIATALVQAATQALRDCGITKVALVAFAENEAGNVFWQTQGFLPRADLVYRDKTLDERMQKTTITGNCGKKHDGTD